MFNCIGKPNPNPNPKPTSQLDMPWGGCKSSSVLDSFGSTWIHTCKLAWTKTETNKQTK